MRRHAPCYALPGTRQDDLVDARSTRHLSDEALVALVARGDESALGGALRPRRPGRVRARVPRSCATTASRRTPCRRASSPSGARPPTFRAERAKASTWILTLVHRRAVDLVRREERRRAEPLETSRSREAADPAGSAEDAAWLGFERDRVQAALRQLPDAQREAIELAYYGGYLAVRAGREARRAAGYDQEQDVRRPRTAARAAATTPEQRDHGRRELTS